MHGVSQTNGPLGRQLGWGTARGDLDVVSAPELRRRRHAEMERATELERQRRARERQDAFIAAASAARRRQDEQQAEQEAWEVVQGRRRWHSPELIAIAAAAFSTSTQALKSPLRVRRLCHARQTAMWLCRWFSERNRHYGQGSFPQIGLKLGGRDHTTVLHGVRKVQAVVDSQQIDGGDSPLEWARLLSELPPSAWKLPPHKALKAVAA